jgi:hypothetical protein|eukprot:SAG25_NODE_200_length_12050_cov_3.693247_10_plen_53_part_00
MAVGRVKHISPCLVGNQVRNRCAASLVYLPAHRLMTDIRRQVKSHLLPLPCT